MYSMKIKAAAASLVLMIAALATAANSNTPAKDKDGPDLPSPLCDHLRVGAENKLHSQVYATGVQIYRWDGNSWVLVGPDATLFANAGYDGKVGKHYVGPTWESNSGSKVVGARMYGCSPDPLPFPGCCLKRCPRVGRAFTAQSLIYSARTPRVVYRRLVPARSSARRSKSLIRLSTTSTANSRSDYGPVSYSRESA